ncbi:MAG: ABC transporter ATP-binding protein [Rubrimonas sp.]
MSVLSIEGLRVGVVGKPDEVVKGVSLTIAAGETLCLVGESGSGKSVTSLAVMGLLPKDALQPRAGRIVLDGVDLTAASQAELRRLRASRMSMIFQEPMTALNPVLSVGDQVEEVLREHTPLSPAERRARVIEMLAQVELPEPERLIHSYPHQLSGGQRQRIMIAMALALDPALLIADEPTTALDVTTQKQILRLIRDLQQRRGAACLFITHDMGVVAEIADRVAVMRHGELVETAPLRQLLTAPAHDYTRALLQAVPSLRPREPRPEPEGPRALQVNELAKTYDDARRTVAARDVSFELAPGRTLGIVGESGSGKSTVARCVMRLIDPTAGAIRVGGVDIAHLSRRGLRPHRRRVQMVFQDPYRSLNPRLKVGESIIEGPVNFGTPRAQAMARARQLMRLVGLPEDAVNRYPHQFSGGQRQRIAIARAVAMEPDILVADEAVSALDVSVQAQVLELLAETQARTGFAMLFITHDLRVAAQICDEVAVMRRGEVVERGPAAQVLAAPAHDYTRALLEAAPGRDWDFANFRPMKAA